MDDFVLVHNGQNGKRNSDSVESCMDLSPWRILTMTHHWAAPDPGAESDMYVVVVVFIVAVAFIFVFDNAVGLSASPPV